MASIGFQDRSRRIFTIKGGVHYYSQAMTTLSEEPKMFGSYGVKAELLILFAFSLSLAVYDAMYYFFQYYEFSSNVVFNGIFFGLLVVLQLVASLLGFWMINKNSQQVTQSTWKVISGLFAVSNTMGFVGLLFKAFSGYWVVFLLLDILLFLVSVTVMILTVHRILAYKNWEQLESIEE